MGKADFSRFFRDLNGYSMDDLDRWLFCPGMVHGSIQKWWGDRGLRTAPHEGVDFCLFTDKGGAVHHLTGKSRIPALYTGAVVSIVPDFLGKTVIMEVAGGEKKVLLLYGHLTPDKTVSVGSEVLSGEALGLVSPPQPATTGLLPHVHVTVAEVHGQVDYGCLDWSSIGAMKSLVFLDPLEFIDGPWSLTDLSLLDRLVDRNR